MQFFADEGADSSGAASSNDTGAESPDPTDQADTGKRFTQADIDRIVAQRLAKQKRDEESRINQAREEARSEAERLAKMTEEQRTQHEREQSEARLKEREDAIAAREAEITKRELRATATETLVTRGLPKELAEILDYSDADKCNASIDSVEKAFRDAVQAGVDSRLKSSAVTLKKGAAQGNAEENLTDGERIASQLGRANAAANKTANDIVAKYR